MFTSILLSSWKPFIQRSKVLMTVINQKWASPKSFYTPCIINRCDVIVFPLIWAGIVQWNNVKVIILLMPY